MLKQQLTECIAKLQFPEIANVQQRGIADKIEGACNHLILSRFGSQVRPAASRRSIEDINIGNTIKNNIKEHLQHQTLRKKYAHFQKPYRHQCYI
jgi:hypothetical protein